MAAAVPHHSQMPFTAPHSLQPRHTSFRSQALSSEPIQLSSVRLETSAPF